MLLNPAQRNESALPSCTQNDRAAQTGLTDLFHGHKIAVAAGGSLDNLPLAAQRTSDQIKRKLFSRHDVTAEQKPASIALKKRLQFFLKGSCSLNKDFSRIIEEDCETNQILVRLANTDGIYNQGFFVKADNKISYDEQHDPDVLFVPCGKDRGYVLAVYEKDLTARVGQKTQWLTYDDVFSPQLPHTGLADAGANYITRLTLSGDSKSLVCLDIERGGAFIGCGPGGWVNKGNCMRYDQLLFSADSNHVAMTCDDELCFMSKGVEGVWTKTGGIDHGPGRWEMVFSPDNRHLVAWVKNSEGHCSKFPGYAPKDFFVIIFALNVSHQWTEKTSITRYVQQSVDSFSLKVGFSPDGRHLLVCAMYEFDIWALSDNGHWLPSMVNVPYVCGDTIRGIDGEVILYSRLNPRVFMLLGRDNGSVWGLQGDGSWSCRLTFFPDWDMLPQISPDGRTIVCKRSFDKNGLWQEQPNGEWSWQRFDFDGQNPRFNQVGSLLAIKESTTEGVLIFMGPDSDGRWREKVRLQHRGVLDSFDFSSHGRSIQVQFIHGGQRVMMILDIVASKKRVKRQKEAL